MSSLTDFITLFRSKALAALDAGEMSFTLPKEGPLFIQGLPSWNTEFITQVFVQISQHPEDFVAHFTEDDDDEPESPYQIQILNQALLRDSVENLDIAGIAVFLRLYHSEDNYDADITQEERTSFQDIIGHCVQAGPGAN